MHYWRSAVLGLALGLTPFAAQAHGGHDEEVAISQSSARARADYAPDQLVANKKIPASWQGKAQTSSDVRMSPAGLLWVVTYANPEETDKSKRTLYVYIDKVGYFHSFNFTGKL